MSRPTDPTWKVRPPIKQGFFDIFGGLTARIFIEKIALVPHTSITNTHTYYNFPGEALHFGSDRVLNSKLRVFRWGFLSEKAGYSVRIPKKGGQTVRIRQTLANFPGKIQIWTYLDKFFEKKIEILKCCQKKGSFGEKFSKICCVLITKKGAHWVKAIWKGGQCGHASLSPIFRKCPQAIFF